MDFFFPLSQFIESSIHVNWKNVYFVFLTSIKCVFHLESYVDVGCHVIRRQAFLCFDPRGRYGDMGSTEKEADKLPPSLTRICDLTTRRLLHYVVAPSITCIDTPPISLSLVLSWSISPFDPGGPVRYRNIEFLRSIRGHFWRVTDRPLIVKDYFTLLSSHWSWPKATTHLLHGD